MLILRSAAIWLSQKNNRKQRVVIHCDACRVEEFAPASPFRRRISTTQRVTSSQKQRAQKTFQECTTISDTKRHIPRNYPSTDQNCLRPSKKLSHAFPGTKGQRKTPLNLLPTSYKIPGTEQLGVRKTRPRGIKLRCDFRSQVGDGFPSTPAVATMG